nr:integrase, catalytic region, zinc finger, CCHC-type, peptidase aspartic, catalytic [Tanacetum cinerariifolium]
YDSIKITRAKHIEQVTKLTTNNVNIKTSVSKDQVKPQVLAREKHAIDVEPVVPRLKNNRDAHLDYLRHLKESVETIRDIVKEAKVHKNHVKPNRISPAKGVNKLSVEDQPRTNKSHLRTSNRMDSSSRLKRTVINLNSDSICQTCNKCLTSSNHDMCVVPCLQSVVATPSIRYNCNVVRKVKQVWKPKQVRQVWKPTEKVLTTIGHQWRPTGQILNLEKQCPLTRFTPPKVVSATQHQKRASACANQKEPNQNWGSKVSNSPSLSGFKCRSYQIVLRYLDSGCSKYMTGDRSRLMNFVKKFIGTVRFGNDHFGVIMGYGDCVIGNSVISRNIMNVPAFFTKRQCPELHNRTVLSKDGTVLSKGYKIYNKRTRRIMETIHVQFDELTEPMAPVHLEQALVNSAATPSYTTIDQDAPTLSISPSSSALQSHSLHQGIAAEPNFMEDHTIAPVDNNPFVNVFAPEPHSEALSYGDISSTESPYISQTLHHLNK